MKKPNPVNKQKKEIVDPVSRLLSFLDNTLPYFFNEFPFDKKNATSMNENILTEALVFFLMNKARTGDFSFMPQSNQETGRTVDIGVCLFGSNLNYFFCIEAKFLPHSPFDYVTGKYAAIKRFKAREHGLNNSIEKKPLAQSGIVAYVKEGKFDDHFVKINGRIKELAENHSQNTDKFGLTWNVAEQLEKVYFESIAKLFSTHPRQNASDVNLHHFWVYVSQENL